ncbi:hypothetical protein F383_31049 [Gossypium arboreum]|uniref:Uncharacterized protein n=1 Tax=Gossypium arboreum TaxID=29729 RepID=A0A0B0PFG0_GOSAR|nr:hypothetical protein F383_23628 [Gossypium arboreum]KHG25178.1 hypothetical protein F383_31049 [Gossypium arboreum]
MDQHRSNSMRAHIKSRRNVKEAARGATRGSPNSLAYSGTFQKLLVLLR